MNFAQISPYLHLFPFSIHSLRQNVLSAEGRHFPPARRRCVLAPSCPLRENVSANGPGADRTFCLKRPVCKNTTINYIYCKIYSFIEHKYFF